MIISASRTITPSTDLEQTLKPFSGKNVQLSFYKRNDFQSINHEELQATVKEYGITVPAIHLPEIDVFHDDFIPVLKKLINIYGVHNFQLHPRNCKNDDANVALKDKARELKGLDIVLAYENFRSGRKRWMHTPEEITSINYSFVKLTYDISHTTDNIDIVEEAEKHFNKLAVVHLSDRYVGRRNRDPDKHLPIGIGDLPIERFLAKLKEKGYQGHITLEYMKEFEDRVLPDLEKVKTMLEQGQAR